jgi:hypothetical protein
MAKSGHKGISRIDQPSKDTFGWYVRVTFNGMQRCKFFSDRAHGGKEKALEAAIRFRNQAEQELGKPRTDRLVIARNPRNSSGIMGVQRKTKVVRTPAGERVVVKGFQVTWNPEPGRVCRIWVPIGESGEKAALLKACAIRRQKEIEMYGSVVKANWVASLGKLLSP